MFTLFVSALIFYLVLKFLLLIGLGVIQILCGLIVLGILATIFERIVR